MSAMAIISMKFGLSLVAVIMNVEGARDARKEPSGMFGQLDADAEGPLVDTASNIKQAAVSVEDASATAKTITERISQLEDQSKPSSCEKLGHAESIVACTECIVDVDHQIEEADKAVTAAREKVNEQAQANPELLMKKKKGWKQSFTKIEPTKENLASTDVDWCAKAKSLGSSVSNWFKGTTLGFGKSYEEKAAANNAQWTIHNFTTACKEWSAEQEKVAPLRKQKAEMEQLKADKQTELESLKVKLPETVEKVKLGGAEIAKDAATVKDQVNDQTAIMDGIAGATAEQAAAPPEEE